MSRGDWMIKLENVTKVYKTGVRAVNNMNVDIL